MKRTLVERTAGRVFCLFTVLVVLLFAGRADAAVLVYFEEDGGGGNPRGFYNYETTTGISTLRTAVSGTERYFALTERPSDGKVFGIRTISPGFATWNNDIFQIDIDTGISILMGTFTTTDAVANITFDPVTGKLYGVERNARRFFEINQTSWTQIPIGTTSAARAGLDFAPDGTLFGIGGGPLYKVNKGTAVDTLVGGVSSTLLFEDAAFTPAGEMFVSTFGGGIYRYNTLTGARTFVSSTGMGNGLLGIMPEPTVVPEPTCLCLLASATFAGLLFRRRTSGRANR
jgi:hypothetical protein